MHSLPTNEQEHIMMVKQQGQLPTVKGPEMNDRDRVNDLLATEKYMMYGYSTSIHEFSHRELFETARQIFNETAEAQRTVFEQMFSLGWYKLPQEEMTTVALAQQQFQNYSAQFPYSQ